jgi:hypothetical protein
METWIEVFLPKFAVSTLMHPLEDASTGSRMMLIWQYTPIIRSLDQRTSPLCLCSLLQFLEHLWAAHGTFDIRSVPIAKEIFFDVLVLVVANITRISTVALEVKKDVVASELSARNDVF